MNDITPPKNPNPHTTPQEAPLPTTDYSGTKPQTNTLHSPQPELKTNVSKPVRRWPKRLALGLLVLLPIIAAAGYGILQFQDASKVYKIGNHSFTNRDIKKAATNLAKSQPTANKPEAKKQLLKEASDSLVLLSALKAEADKRNIPYDKGTIDAKMSKIFEEKGGKQAYFDYMKKQYSYNEQATYDVLTTQYLKQSLEPIIISKKQFAIIYVRWDGIKLFDPENFETEYKRREAEMNAKYLPLLKGGASVEVLRGEVELSDTADEATTKQVFDVTNNTPVGLQLLTTGNVTFENYQDGVDVMEQLNTLKKPGDVVGPFKGADGRLAVARLEEVASDGGYASWDDFLTKSIRVAGITKTDDAQKSFGMISKRVVTAISSALTPQQAEAAAVELNCASSGYHRVTYNVTLVNSENNQRLWQTYTMGAGSTRAIGPNSANDDWCSKSNYEANGFSVGGANSEGFASVGKIFSSDSFGYLRLILDCWGPAWSIGPAQPAIQGFTYVGSSGSFVFNSSSNGQTYDLTFRYKPKPADNPPPPSPNTPYCTMTSAPAEPGIWTVSWTSYNYFGAELSGRLYNSITGNTDNSVPLSKSGHRVTATVGQTGTVTFTMLNSGKPTGITCSANIGSTGSNPPPSTPPPPPAPTGYYDCGVTTDGRSPFEVPGVTNEATVSLASGDTLTMKVAIGFRYFSDESQFVSTGQRFTWQLRAGSFSDTVIDTQPPQGQLPAEIATFVRNPTGNQLYRLNTGPGLGGASVAGGIGCYVTVQLGSPPIAPTYGPWLQTKKGNVLALQYIKSQLSGQKGSRPAAAAVLEAEHVVMGYLAQGGGQQSNFCSTNVYNFGIGAAAACSYAAGPSGYSYKAPSGIGNASSDPAIVSLEKAATGRGGLDPSTCNSKVPYSLANSFADLPTLLGAASDACPVVSKVVGNVTLNNATIPKGRGTLYVVGDVTINGNITYNYGGGRFSSINTIPNLGIVATGSIKIAPNVTNIDASLYALDKVETCNGYPSTACNVKLTVRGKLAAANGFKLGRSYWLGNGDPASEQPAELIIGSGLLEAFPPPGFVNLTLGASDVQVISTEANPRF